jgi:hypothetical protein
MKNKPMITAIISKLSGSKEEPEGMEVDSEEEGEDVSIEDAAQELIDAVKAEDAKAVASILKDLFQAFSCDCSDSEEE